jgi:hypothetical protein
MGAEPGETQRGGAPDAGGRAGDDRDPISEKSGGRLKGRQRRKGAMTARADSSMRPPMSNASPYAAVWIVRLPVYATRPDATVCGADCTTVVAVVAYGVVP